MGCDIHCYIEHAADSAEPRWMPFGGRINPGRDYRMFGILAGLRDSREPIFPLRGAPENMAYSAKGDNELYITESESEDYVKPEVAARWVKEGSSRYTDERKLFVTSPDWHSHSWLTPDEWEVALAEGAKTHWGEPDPEYYAILAAMRCFQSKGQLARIVFWFDN